MKIGIRSDVYTSQPHRPGFGTSRHWRRVINDVPYSFSIINMPDGEIRYSVTKYNGYCRNSVNTGLMTMDKILEFGCAWSPVHFVTIKPLTLNVGDTVIDDDEEYTVTGVGTLPGIAGIAYYIAVDFVSGRGITFLPANLRKHPEMQHITVRRMWQDQI